MPSVPTQRTLKRLKEEGYTPAIVEKYNYFSRTRQDLYNFADIVAIHPEKLGVLAIQTTSGSNASARRKKILDNPIVKIWLLGGNKVEVWSWAKQGPRGKRKVYTLKVTAIKLEEYE